MHPCFGLPHRPLRLPFLSQLLPDPHPHRPPPSSFLTCPALALASCVQAWRKHDERPGLSETVCLTSESHVWGNRSGPGTVAPPGGRTLPEVQPEEPGCRGVGHTFPDGPETRHAAYTQRHAFTGTPVSSKQHTQPQKPNNVGSHTHVPMVGVSGRRGTRDPDHTRWRHRPLCGDRLHRGPDTRTPHRHQAALCTHGLCPPQTQSCLANLETPVSGPSPSSPEQGGWPRWVGGLRLQQ